MIRGECLCGDVRFEIDGNVSAIWLCHCSKCRRSSGSAFHPAAICRRAKFRWVSGADALTVYRSPSGYQVNFCTRCGSPAPFVRDDVEQVVLSAGSLEASFEGRVAYQIFAASKAHWWHLDPELPTHDEHAPTPGA